MTGSINPSLLLAIPLAPLLGALIAGFLGKRVGRVASHSVTILGVGVACALSIMVLGAVMGGDHYDDTVYTWATLGDLQFQVGFLIDSLTATMMVVVTFVSLMVHIYTIGYMREDAGYTRFFCLYLAVHLLDADAGDGQQSSATVLRLGSRGPGVISPDRLLVHQARPPSSPI
jgi:NADH-quinone oxidoreductase subunit L